MLLGQGHQALIELDQVRPTDEQADQQRHAKRCDQVRCPRLVAQRAVDADAQQQGQGSGHHAGFGPETFGQGQAHGGTGRPAGQQVGHRPARTGNQADHNEARQGHVEHAGNHWQHGPQWADEATDQQAGDTVALEVAFGAADPFRVVAQQGQAPDVLVKTPP
ncbi:hypothetical protein D3C85_1042040 [compost metagenome]